MVRRRWATPDGRRRWTFPDEYDWPDYSHEYDTQGYRDPADYLTMTQPREEAAIPQSGCPLCGSHNSYACLTKNRQFCWDCGRYYGSSH